jgi:hypothetical protein
MVVFNIKEDQTDSYVEIKKDELFTYSQVIFA